MFGVSKIELPQAPQFEYRALDPVVAARLIALELKEHNIVYSHETDNAEKIILDTLRKLLGEPIKNEKENVENVSNEE